MLSHLQFPDLESLSVKTASILAGALQTNRALTLCMASGHSPARTAELFVENIISLGIDYSELTFIGLDEWVGLPPLNEGSCRYFFEQKIFGPLQLESSQCHVFDGMATDLEGECSKMDGIIERKGIDIAVVGIGMNGHIGFNEPGTPFDIKCHVADLDVITTNIGQKYFKDPTPLSKGITIGFHHLMNAKRLILIANGERKAEVIRQALEGPITPDFPASIIRKHPDALIITDFAASSLLGLQC
jgi:galactosamine-6-phosphate isomerase